MVWYPKINSKLAQSPAMTPVRVHKLSVRFNLRIFKVPEKIEFDE